MPFVSWALGMIFHYGTCGGIDTLESTCFPKTYALGLLMTGSMPGGSTSNMFCYWSGGDTALSIIMTVFSTFCALFMVPLVLAIYGSSFTSDNLKINFGSII